MAASTTTPSEQEGWEDTSENGEESAPTIKVDSLDLSALSINETDKGHSKGAFTSFLNVTHSRNCQCKVTR